MRTSLSLILALVVLASGCHKNNRSPAAPTPVTPVAPTVTALSLSPLQDLQKMAATQQLTATATFSDGASSVVAGTWTTDAPGIVSVSGTGLVTGLAPGEANVFVDYQGQRASRHVRIIPDYAGNWSGAFRITDCRLLGDWTVTTGCDGEVSPTNWLLTFSASQDRTAVSGTVVTIADLPVPATGNIAVDGTLTMSGNSTITVDGDDWTAGISDWKTRSVTSSGVVGSFTFTYGLRQYQGGIQWTCEIVGLERALFQSRPTRLPARVRASRALRP